MANPKLRLEDDAKAYLLWRSEQNLRTPSGELSLILRDLAKYDADYISATGVVLARPIAVGDASASRPRPPRSLHLGGPEVPRSGRRPGAPPILPVPGWVGVYQRFDRFQARHGSGRNATRIITAGTDEYATAEEAAAAYDHYLRTAVFPTASEVRKRWTNHPEPGENLALERVNCQCGIVKLLSDCAHVPGCPGTGRTSLAFDNGHPGVVWLDERVVRRQLRAPCCENEKRNMNGGCDNCGDPCL